MGKSALFAVILFCSASVPTLAGDSDWLGSEGPIALKKMLANISPSDCMPGTVVASPSKADPDYYFHWVRDAALIMDSVAKLYSLSADKGTRNTYLHILRQFASLSRFQQTTPTHTGLGEPKFLANGLGYDGPWGRPQNDGPALRAIALIKLADILLASGEETEVRTRLYDSQLPTQSVIKADLEYVAHHWRDSSFDLWEETKGDHFYTRMVQRKALLKGAELAKKLGDLGAASYYTAQALELKSALEQHWDPNRGILVATLNRVEGIDYKHSGLDTAVVLGVLHGYADDEFFSIVDPRVQSTLRKLDESFTRVFAINRRPDLPGVAIGRYPEDRYGGTDFNAGNPWVLATLAFSEAYFLSERQWRSKGNDAEANRARRLADLYVARVRVHAYGDGSLSEQMHRETGFMTSARDLTWNYGAVLTALWARSGK